MGLSFRRLPLGVLLAAIVVFCWGPATAAHGQTDSTLVPFLKENIVENEVRFENTDEAAEYLRTRDPGELRIIRNALFAQHGYVFDDSTLQAYFDDMDWYEAEDKEVSLSTTDEANAKFVQSLEDRAQSQLDTFYEKFPPCDLPLQIDDSPNSDTSLDSLSVALVFGTGTLQTHGRYHPSCTIQKTDRYRVLLYSVLGPAAVNHTYSTASLSATGRLRSTKDLLNFAASQEATEHGILSITTNASGVRITVKDVETRRDRIQGEWRPTQEKTTWHRFTIDSDGTLEPLREDR